VPPNAVVNNAELAIIHIKRGSESKAWMSVKRFPIIFGPSGGEAEACPYFRILPFALEPVSSSVLILNISDCCGLACFLSRSFLPIFPAAEVPNFLNFVLKTSACSITLVHVTPRVS